MSSQMEISLSQLPAFTRLITPDPVIFMKHSDGFWYNLVANNAYGHALVPDYNFPDGTLAYYVNEQAARFVKHGSKWLSTQVPPETSASNSATGHPASHRGVSSSPRPLRILEQEPYHHGEAPLDDLVVEFGIPMSSAEREMVTQGDLPAFFGGLAVKEKASIRFGFEYADRSGYKEKQHNIQRAGVRITRGQLAALVAQEVRLLMGALERNGTPLRRSPSGRRLVFEELILVDVKRVSRGTLQPTIAIH